MADFELDTQSYLPEQGENKGTHGVNADGDADLTQSGSVQGDGFVHVGRETADKQAKALIDPGREDEEDESERHEPAGTGMRIDEQRQADGGEDDGHPHEEGNPAGDAIITGEQENQRSGMAGNAAVECGEHFKQIEEDVQAHGIGDNGGQSPDGGFAGVEASELAQHEDEQKQNGRSGTEGGGQEAGSQ